SGIDEKKLAWVMELKNDRRGRMREYVDAHPGAEYLEGQRPWAVRCDVPVPRATENEISAADAETLLASGCVCVAEGANMPSEPGAVAKFVDGGILFAPGKAANAGGVAVSGLEMTQNAMRLSWIREEVDQRLQLIMQEIHKTCVG